MRATFDKVLQLILMSEGGYSNDPRDPGGETNHGITQRVYAAFRQNKSLPVQSVKNISNTEVRDIYLAQYANKIRFDDLPAGVDYAVLDGAVNSGPSQAVKWLQRAVGIAPDGQLGEATLAAVRAAEPDDVINAVCARRLAFMQALRTWPTFGKGWSRRVSAVRQQAIAIADGSASIPAVDTTGGHGKALLAHAKPLPGKGAADAATGGGGASAVVATGLSQVEDALQPVADGNQWIGYTIAAIGVIGILLAGAGLAYRYYATKKAAELSDALDLPKTDAAPLQPLPVPFEPAQEGA